jgi:hypothetical protein
VNPTLPAAAAAAHKQQQQQQQRGERCLAPALQATHVLLQTAHCPTHPPMVSASASCRLSATLKRASTCSAPAATCVCGVGAACLQSARALAEAAGSRGRSGLQLPAHQHVTLYPKCLAGAAHSPLLSPHQLGHSVAPPATGQRPVDMWCTQQQQQQQQQQGSGKLQGVPASTAVHGQPELAHAKSSLPHST